MGRKITLLGMGMSALRRAEDIARWCEGTEIWSLNNAYTFFPTLRDAKAFSRMFELHGWQYLRNWSPGETAEGQKIDHWRELDRLGCPVYVTEHVPVVREQIQYPHVVVWQHFSKQWGQAYGPAFKLYFKGSPCLMLALALVEHDMGQPIEYLQSYGLDHRDPTHEQQRGPWAWWTCAAASRGIRLGGTMLAYQDEHDKDEGLAGLQDHIAGLVKAADIQPDAAPAAGA